MNDKRRLEILGILSATLSIFIFVSLITYNSNEEPSISPNLKVENAMGILGVYLSHYFIKLGFGYATLIVPFVGLHLGWTLFSNKKINEIHKIVFYSFNTILLISITSGVLFKSISSSDNYTFEGLIGGLIANLLLDWLHYLGTILFLISCWLILFRGVFNINYYGLTTFIVKRSEAWIKNQKSKYNHRRKEELKRKHTEELKEKISKKRDKELYHTEQNNLTENSDSSNFQTDPNEKETLGDNGAISDNYSEDKIPKLDNVESSKDLLKDSLQKPIKEKNKDQPILADKEKQNLNIEEIKETEEVDIDKAVERKKPKRKYQLPSSELLENPVNISDNLSRDELVERANYLTQSMSTFGVEGTVVNVHPGPIITLFEVEPAEGVRVNKFVQLADDLARVMEASSVRVIAPIPGKSSVGVEIPNRNPATVFFKSVVNSQEFVGAESLLTLAIGKTTSGEISILNLAKMPHLLIAGTTGSGKSVCINTIICSIIYRATPDEVKFVMIDPKKVEMTLYKQLADYHLLKMEDIKEPIITSVDNAILALRALEKEMDRRYNVLADAVVRNISEYNEKMLKNNEAIMPYIILVVDELADLMMLSAKDVEAPIARLAQLARAVGIHLVIATQRPSVDVITGVIKANFPSRIAFQVASKIDSRTIIDQPGADKLIGRGDMLHLGTGSSDVFRMHNAYLSLDEIESIMSHVVEQPKPDELILPSVRESQYNDLGSEANSGKDEMFHDAISLVITHQQGSISLLQRRLKVGYSRAARLIDEMEQAGIVGPFTGSKAREVLVDETYLEMIRD